MPDSKEGRDFGEGHPDATPYKDPDEFIKNLGAEEFEKRIQAARNGFLFETG